MFHRLLFTPKKQSMVPRPPNKNNTIVNDFNSTCENYNKKRYTRYNIEYFWNKQKILHTYGIQKNKVECLYLYKIFKDEVKVLSLMTE